MPKRIDTYDRVSEYMDEWDKKRNSITLEQFNRVALLFDREEYLKLASTTKGESILRQLSREFESMLVSPYKETDVYSGDEVVFTLPPIFMEIKSLDPSKVNIYELEKKFDNVERNDFTKHEAAEGIRRYMLYSQDKEEIKAARKRAKELSEEFKEYKSSKREPVEGDPTEEPEQKRAPDDMGEFLDFE